MFEQTLNKLKILRTLTPMPSGWCRRKVIPLHALGGPDAVLTRFSLITLNKIKNNVLLKNTVYPSHGGRTGTRAYGVFIPQG